jgi:peroxiredoxin
MYNQAIAEPDLKPGIAEDFYIVLFQWLPSGTVSINVMINPLSNFLWIGSIILLLGGILAWLPKKESNSEGSAQRSRILIVLVCILFFLMMIFAMWGNQINLSKGNARPLVGQIAPEFSGLDVNGSIYETGDCSNKVLILHFWATWCEQCEEELLLLNDLWQQTDPDKVCFIGVAMNDTQAAVANMISELGITFVMIPDPEGEISQKFGVRAVPETFVVDQEGVVTYIKIGVVDGEILAFEINSLMGNGR